LYQLDTNIWIEHLLKHRRFEEVKQMLDQIPTVELVVSDLTFHSIGIILARLNKQKELLQFVDDVSVAPPIQFRSLLPSDVKDILSVMKQYSLDFEDDYQYTIAEKFDIEIVSFDTDFDRTPKKRKTPAQVLAERLQQ